MTARAGPPPRLPAAPRRKKFGPAGPRAVGAAAGGAGAGGRGPGRR